MGKSLQRITTGQSRITATPKFIESSYIVLLINSTDFVIEKVSVSGGPWAATQAIGKTCGSMDYDICATAGRWRELCSVSAGQNVTIKVGYQKNGRWWETSWDAFYADPQFAGGIIHMDRG